MVGVCLIQLAVAQFDPDSLEGHKYKSNDETHSMLMYLLPRRRCFGGGGGVQHILYIFVFDYFDTKFNIHVYALGAQKPSMNRT